MEMQSVKSLHPIWWIAGIAVIVFCATGVAAILGWIPTSMSQSKDATALSSPGIAQPLATHTAPTHIVHERHTEEKCIGCGVIESTREISTNGSGSGLGVIGGAVVGGLLGNQVGKGHGRDAATVVGAIGGGVAGNAIEKRVKSTTSYEVTVRMNDGSTRVIQEANATTWRSGDHVKIVDGEIRSN